MLTCTRKGGHGIPCGAVLAIDTDRLGRVITSCPRCTRRERGVCQHCPRPVTGKVGLALYCDEHRVEAQKLRCARWYHRDIEHGREVRKASWRRRHVPDSRTPEEIARARGFARAAALTPEQRREIASRGGRARWARAKERAA